MIFWCSDCGKKYIKVEHFYSTGTKQRYKIRQIVGGQSKMLLPKSVRNKELRALLNLSHKWLIIGHAEKINTCCAR